MLTLVRVCPSWSGFDEIYFGVQLYTKIGAPFRFEAVLKKILTGENVLGLHVYVFWSSNCVIFTFISML